MSSNSPRRGLAAHEGGDIDGVLFMFYDGSRKLFAQALDTLRQGAPQWVVNTVKALVDRALRQWDLVDRLLAGDGADAALDDARELVDGEFLALLRTRVLSLAQNPTPVEQVLAGARLVALVGQRLGQDDDILQRLQDFYVGYRMYDEAETIIQARLETQPGNVDLILTLADTLRLAGKIDAARTLLTQALQKHPNRSELHFSLGLILLVAGDRDG